jgi:Raf kinase inhibitor-like YbhB/YbcL family protein
MKVELHVTSPAFSANGAIPPEYTCDGRSIAPPLSWSTVPSNTRSIAILVDDPDAPKGMFTHWLVTGIPPTTTSLREGAKLPEGARVAKNGKGNFGYTGPCPPSGRHHYYFHIYALGTEIARPESKSDFLAAIDGHILAEGELVGTYQKITPP